MFCFITRNLFRVENLQITQSCAAFHMMTKFMQQHAAHLPPQFRERQFTVRHSEGTVVDDNILAHRRMDTVFAHDIQIAVYTLRMAWMPRIDQNAAVEFFEKRRRYLLRDFIKQIFKFINRNHKYRSFRTYYITSCAAVQPDKFV